MTKIDWTKFVRRICIDTSAIDIYDSFTSGSALQKWFLKEAIFYTNDKQKEADELIESGDKYKWTWHGSNNIAEGKVISIGPGSHLTFSFLDCMVSVEVKQEHSQNLVELIQYDIPTDEESRLNYYVECTRGWTFYLANLKSILEGGLDLRNKDMKMQGVINT